MRPDSIAKSTMELLHGRRTEMSRLLDRYNAWRPTATSQGTAWDELPVRHPPGTERQFRFLDSLSVLVSRRLRTSVDSFPALDYLGFDWSDRAISRPDSLVVAFNVRVRYRYRNPVGYFEGRTVLPARADAEADLLEVASQTAPRLAALYPEVECYRFDQVFDVTPTLKLEVPRALAVEYGDDVRKYSSNAVRCLTPVGSAVLSPALRLVATRELVEQAGWK